jgi:S-methylmethionine-dependent homocysteine/selenocysteine methylase
MFTLEEHLEEQNKKILSIRSNELSSSDWTQMPDVSLPSEVKQAWATYRQAWRDITTQEGYPTKVIYPVKPQAE